MASNDKDNYAFNRRDVITPCLDYQTPGSSSSAWQCGQIGSLAMARLPTESSIQGTCLQTVKCSLPNNSFFSPSNNWDTATVMDTSLPFQSTAMVSASQGTMPFPNACEINNMSDGVVIREMIGRLGGHYSSSQTLRASGLDRVLNVGWNAPENPSKDGIFIQGGGSTALSPHHGLAQFPSDAGFADRAARFSGFGVGTSFNHTEGTSTAYPISGCTRHPVDNSGLAKISRLSGIQAPKNEPNMVEVINASSSSKEEVGVAETGPRTAETKAGRLSRSSTPGLGTSGNESDEAEFSTGHEESSSSDQITGEAASRPLNARKRKKKDEAEDLPSLVMSHAGRNTKSAETNELKGVKYKLIEGMKDKGDLKSKAEQSSSANTGEGSPNQAKHNAQDSGAPKEDYIHVRARRGQATNSHSLAERVRREKISERMKFLQDLVPGCSKVTGKAVMLDEIINYVQSLQRQVEFLSMKLATVNPRLDFSLEGLLAKDMLQSQGSLPTMGFVPDTNASYPQIHHPQQGPIQVGVEGHNVGSPVEALRRTMNAQLASIDGYRDAVSQVSNVWDDELQSVVQMGFTQNTQAPLTSQGLNGSLPMTHMKVEL